MPKVRTCFFAGSICVLGGLTLGVTPLHAAPIIFDNFNVNEGHFNVAPNFSSQSTGESAASTADRVTTNSPLEGAGHQKLSLIFDGTAAMRIRHLANSGTPTATNTFTVNNTSNPNAWIGFYMKTTATGITAALNLDDSTNAGAGMDMGNAKAVIADGQYHLYEWKLSDANQWAAVTSIGGDGTVQDGTHSVDSIYIFTNRTGTADEVLPDIFIDFVALNDNGSVANLIPEPSSAAFALGGLLLFRRTARRHSTTG